MMTAHFMMQSTAILQRDLDQSALSGLGGLADGFRHFAGFAMAETDAAGTVTNDHQRSKTKATTALYHFGDAIDVNQLVDQIRILLFPITTTAAAAVPGVPLLSFTRHISSLLSKTKP